MIDIRKQWRSIDANNVTTVIQSNDNSLISLIILGDC